MEQKTEENENKIIENARKILLAFEEKLKLIESARNQHLNIFNAVGMRTQEIKHSAFLAWLLNPQNPHNLKNKFLKKILEELFTIQNSENEFQAITNREILTKAKIKSINDLKEFLSSEDLKIETEKVISGIDSRIDIFIQSRSAKTVIVIENKVFTTTHDNQLSRYEDKLDGLDGDWKKIFIYLTPQGDLPLEEDKNKEFIYKEKWCVFSYRAILKIVEELLNGAHFKNQKNLKLKLILEDYKEMVENYILKDNDIEKLCKKIRREHKEAFKMLLEYSDNIEEVTEYCAGWIKKNIPDINIKINKSSFEFYTLPMKKFYESLGGRIEDGKIQKLRCVFGYGDNIPITVALQKNAEEDWDAAQKAIINIFAANRKSSNKYLSLNNYTVELLSAEERKFDLDDVVQKLEKNLQEFAAKLKEFENALINSSF